MIKAFKLFAAICILLIAITPSFAQVYDDDILFEELRMYESREFDDVVSVLSEGNSDPRNPLTLTREDILFVRPDDADYINLYVKKTEMVNSILITTALTTIGGTEFGNLEYGLRALNYNEINGEEIRVFRGQTLGADNGLYFLVDSTPVQHATMGMVFHIRIPDYVMYGYPPEGDFGYMRIVPGDTRINIRTFERAYADYRGAFQDNIVVVDLNRYNGADLQPPELEQTHVEYVNNEYVAVYITYTDNNMFFSGFYIKDYDPYTNDEETSIVQNTYRRINFTRDDSPMDECAVLLNSFYRQGYGKVIEVKIFLRREETERHLIINARDQFDNQAMVPISIIIPTLSSSNASIQDTQPESTPTEWLFDERYDDF